MSLIDGKLCDILVDFLVLIMIVYIHGNVQVREMRIQVGTKSRETKILPEMQEP